MIKHILASVLFVMALLVIFILLLSETARHILVLGCLSILLLGALGSLYGIALLISEDLLQLIKGANRFL